MPPLHPLKGEAAIAPLLEGEPDRGGQHKHLCRTGTPNESDSWDVVQMWALKHNAGRSSLFVHHAGKTGARFGTSKREDVLDTVIALRRHGDYTPAGGCLLHLRKRGDSAATEPTDALRPWTKTNTAEKPLDMAKAGTCHL